MRKKIGLALGSGGARGISHIGVIKGLLELGVKIDLISGSSAGAMIGGMYAAGVGVDKIEEIVSDLDYFDMWRLLSDPVWGKGLLKGDKLVEFLNKHLDGVRIENTKIPFCAMATDVRTGEKVTLSEGNLAEAIRASCSVPLIFEPYSSENRLLVDGGVSSPVPVTTLKEMGADRVIAVNLDAIYFLDKNKKNKREMGTVSVVENSYNILRFHLAKWETKDADVVLEPEIEYVHDFDLAHKDSYLASGFEVTIKNKGKILDLLT